MAERKVGNYAAFLDTIETTFSKNGFKVSRHLTAPPYHIDLLGYVCPYGHFALSWDVEVELICAISRLDTVNVTQIKDFSDAFYKYCEGIRMESSVNYSGRYVPTFVRAMLPIIVSTNLTDDSLSYVKNNKPTHGSRIAMIHPVLIDTNGWTPIHSEDLGFWLRSWSKLLNNLVSRYLSVNSPNTRHI